MRYFIFPDAAFLLLSACSIIGLAFIIVRISSVPTWKRKELSTDARQVGHFYTKLFSNLTLRKLIQSHSVHPLSQTQVILETSAMTRHQHFFMETAATGCNWEPAWFLALCTAFVRWWAGHWHCCGLKPLEAILLPQSSDEARPRWGREFSDWKGFLPCDKQ